MPRCQLLETCIFFNDKMGNMPAVAGMMKQQYCLNDNSKCARYLIFTTKGRDSVPKDLYPGDKERADKLLEA